MGRKLKHAAVECEYYKEEHSMCVSLPVTQTALPRACLVQMKFRWGANTLQRNPIKLPCLVMYPKLHANTMQMQQNQ